MDDSFRREDLRPTPPTPPRMAMRMRWCVRLGQGGPANHQLYTRAQALRFVRLAKRLGVDTYARRFGRVWVPI